MVTHRKWFFWLLALALLVRLAAGCVWQSRLKDRFGMGDSDGYWQLGLSIARGEPYQYGSEDMRVFRMPGYPVLLSPILWAAGDTATAVFWARVEAALLGVLAVVMVWWIARMLADERTALLAAAFAAFYPGAVVLSTWLLSEAPFCPLLLLQLALWIVAWQSKTAKKTAIFAVFAGLIAGAATLMRPSWLLFTPFATGVGMLMAWRDRATLLRHLAIGTCMAMGLCAAMLPWWIRNAQVTGRFVPTTLQVGASLYDGLSPEATGGSNMDFVPRFTDEERKASLPADGKPHEPFEVRLDRRLRDASLAWAKAHPGEVLSLAVRKFSRIWNIWPNDAEMSSWPLRLCVLFTYPPLLIFAIIGAWRTFGRGWPYRLCWLPAVYFTLLHVVFVSSLRYREPAMLAMLALAAIGVAGIGDWGWKARRIMRTPADP